MTMQLHGVHQSIWLGFYVCVHLGMCVSACECGELNNSRGHKDDFKTEGVFIHLHIPFSFIFS